MLSTTAEFTNNQKSEDLIDHKIVCHFMIYYMYEGLYKLRVYTFFHGQFILTSLFQSQALLTSENDSYNVCSQLLSSCAYTHVRA